MASKKKKISVLLDEGRVALPRELIPKGVTQFECEQSEDGRIILSPLKTTSNASPNFARVLKHERGKEEVAQVIDFQESRAFRRKRCAQKSRENFSVAQSGLLGRNGEFVKLHLFSSRLEAEMLGEILRQSEIPYLIQSEDIGLFGPGASPAPGGARLVVRKCDLEDARDLLIGLI